MDRKAYMRAYYQAHKEELKARMREHMVHYRETHPDYVEKNRERAKARYHARKGLQNKVEA